MEMTALEKRLIEKLDQGLLDGLLPQEIHWHRDGVICRMMILRGIPYFICYMPKPDYGKPPAMEPALQVRVSQSPPKETAVRITSSKELPSRKAVIASGTVS